MSRELSKVDYRLRVGVLVREPREVVESNVIAIELNIIFDGKAELAGGSSMLLAMFTVFCQVL